VLIVDDDPDDIFLTQRLLKKAGFDLGMLAATGGREAIAFLEQTLAGSGPKPSVLLLDLKMPEPNGFDVTKWLRTKKALRDVKIVILTNSDDPGDRRKALEFGADRYLVKNPTAKEIAATFRELLQP
jgi:CheY-like chemotaxis protein